MKVCIKCKEVKKKRHFHRRKDATDGYNNTCKMCISAKNRELYKKRMAAT